MALHDKQDLLQRQSLPLRAKILMTERRIREWVDYWNGDVYVSFSGGKDSTVLKHIVDQMYDNIPAVFVNTGLEYPEIQQFVREVKAGKYPCFNPDVEIIRPEIRFDEVIKKYGYPVISKEVSSTIQGARKSIEKGAYSLRLCKLGVTRDEYGGLSDDGAHDYDKTLRGSKFNQRKWRYLLDADFKISSYCCDVIKKRPAANYEKRTGRRPIIATMACESLNRENEWFKNGCNGFDTPNPKSHPMSFWTEQDILHYIKEYGVPYCPVYGEIRVKPPNNAIDGQINAIDFLGSYDAEDILETTGCTRTGCMFCMFGCHLDPEPNRFQRMKITHPKQYEYCMNQLGLKEVLEYIGVPYE